MGCCMSEETKVMQPYYKTLSTKEVAELIPYHTKCSFCGERVPHPYVLLEQCTYCHIVGHVQCVSIHKISHSTCPKCKFLIVRK